MLMVGFPDSAAVVGLPGGCLSNVQSVMDQAQHSHALEVMIPHPACTTTTFLFLLPHLCENVMWDAVRMLTSWFMSCSLRWLAPSTALI